MGMKCLAQGHNTVPKSLINLLGAETATYVNFMQLIYFYAHSIFGCLDVNYMKHLSEIIFLTLEIGLSWFSYKIHLSQFDQSFQVDKEI